MQRLHKWSAKMVCCREFRAGRAENGSLAHKHKEGGRKVNTHHRRVRDYFTAAVEVSGSNTRLQIKI